MPAKFFRAGFACVCERYEYNGSLVREVVATCRDAHLLPTKEVGARGRRLGEARYFSKPWPCRFQGMSGGTPHRAPCPTGRGSLHRSGRRRRSCGPLG